MSEQPVRIGAAIMCQNSLYELPRCLQSLGFADTIGIVDGCSTDGTWEYLQKRRDKRLILAQHPFDMHFGLQRQRSFDLIKDKVDWILRIDSDETAPLFLGNELREVCSHVEENIWAIRIQQINLLGDYDHYAVGPGAGGWETHPRIFRTTHDISWLGNVHEFVDGSTNDAVNWNVSILHYGWLDKIRLRSKGIAYSKIPNSGFKTPEELTDRKFELRLLPPKYQDVVIRGYVDG